MLNVDGTENISGLIKYYVYLNLQIHENKHKRHNERTYFLVTDTGADKFILGAKWLRHHNPDIDWNNGKISFHRCNCKQPYGPVTIIAHQEQIQPIQMKSTKEDSVEEYPDYILPYTELDATNGRRYRFHLDGIEDIGKARATLTKSQELAHAKADKKEKTFEELVLSHYHKWKSVFELKASEHFPISRPWDHAIDLIPDYKPKQFKVYPLNEKKKDSLNEFIDEQL